jgi:hypothetical protein
MQPLLLKYLSETSRIHVFVKVHSPNEELAEDSIHGDRRIFGQ